ncbi:hypothetical protein GCK32_006416 [Trichostrongylus colubriformis]|uniref:Uncharacterized protein n=1 Tax=Trichostrongylus colubriformis TaxID=6319 RepID=A0AAN8F2W5_TRICO
MLFNKLKMNLREFTSNDEEFNRSIKDEDRSQETHPSTLGVTWSTKEDVHDKKNGLKNNCFNIRLHGILGPHNTSAEDILAEVMDEELRMGHQVIAGRHHKLAENQVEGKGIREEDPKENRRKAATHQLVVCTDASIEAMCAVVYLRNKESQNILIAKSRLPALRAKHTIPKLELNALTMGARLSINTMTELEGQIKIDQIFILCDSEIALSWVKNWRAHTDTGVLLRNRCKEIAEISGSFIKRGIPVQFGYINTKINPADLGTTGISGSEFRDSMCWNGPQEKGWLENSQLFQMEDLSTLEEETSVNMTEVAETTGWTEDARYNSMSKSKRITAWVLPFVRRIAQSLPQSRREIMRTRIPELLEAKQEGQMGAK